MTTLDFIIYLPLIFFAIKRGGLITIQNVKIGIFKR